MDRQTKSYRAALVGCSRMGAFIDNEVVGSPSTLLPYSHAAGYEACARTELVAGCDLRPDVLARFGARYRVAPEHLYTDYREMLRRERPDTVSVATQPEQRAEVMLFAIENGVRALYPEKPFCASMDEARRVVEAVERSGVVLNMGTNRRWHPGFHAMRRTIASGELGALNTLISYANGTLFNTSSHWFDLLLFLAGDAPVAWVQAYLPQGDRQVVGDEVIEDPPAQGTIAFESGVMAHALLSTRDYDHEAVCADGTITAASGDTAFYVRRFGDAPDRGWRDQTTLDFTPASTTLTLIEDVVRALDTGAPTLGGARVAYRSTEVIFGFIESHRRGGARVPFPLVDSRLRFNRRGLQPKQPRFQP
jgi:predicted dehydrogenase